MDWMGRVVMVGACICCVESAFSDGNPSKASVLPAVRSESITGAALPPEGYRIRIDGRGEARIEAADEAGRFYAEQTLAQLPRPLAQCEIEDWPAYSWRGVHLDESRHFFGKDVVKRILDEMAAVKMNVFHWHLMDDNGNRIPLRRHPKMNTVGATRHAPDFSPWMHDTKFGSYGPFGYTAGDIAEVCAYAKARHIRIVPEVEIPGHSREVLTAYPELFCGTKTDFAQACVFLSDKHSGRMDPTAVCLGNPETIRFFEDVLDDVCELFPDADVVHIGGDECPSGNWAGCPKCRAKMKELGISEPRELQNWCTRHFVDYLAKKGRRAIGWDEIVEGGIADGAYVMSWRGASGGRAAAKSGHCAVMSPHTHCYLDYPQGLGDRDECRYPAWEGVPQLPLEKVYSFDPVEGIPESEQKYILGGQVNNWTEYTVTPKELEWKLWPRALAAAEVLWTGPGRRTFADFKARLLPHVARMKAAGLTVAPVE